MSTIRRLGLPTAVYLTVTVMIPALNGSASRPDFWVHALWVVATSLGVIGMLAGVRRACRGRMVRTDRTG